MKPYKIVGISGKAGTGKDFITDKYFKPNKYHQYSLAWHFKVWLVGSGQATYEEVFHTKPPHIRKLLQEEGTERGRNVHGEDIWCNVMIAWMDLLHEQWKIQRFVVADIRFPNEANLIKKYGGTLLRIVAPQREEQSTLTVEQRQHISETALDEYVEYDDYIYNDPSDQPLEFQSWHRRFIG